jgi:hypothetical protein
MQTALSAGVVLIDVQLEYFRKLFSGLSLGENGSLALIRKDGAMMMRQPFDAKVIGRNIRNASTFKRFIAEPEGSFSDISYLMALIACTTSRIFRACRSLSWSRKRTPIFSRLGDNVH